MARVVALQRRTILTDQLRQFVGRRVEVATPGDNVIGTLRRVFTGHLEVTNEDGAHFVRMPHICWVRPEPPPSTED